MLGVGHKFPAYSLQAVVSLEKGKAFQTVSNEDFKDKWKVFFFWPKDFTFVCPTEIAAFGKLNGEFQDRDAQLLGGSTDSEFVHHAWRTNHADLRDLPFPMLADVKRELCTALGILDPQTFRQLVLLTDEVVSLARLPDNERQLVRFPRLGNVAPDVTVVDGIDDRANVGVAGEQ